LSSSPEWTPRKSEFAVEFAEFGRGWGGGRITGHRLLWEGEPLVGAEWETRCSLPVPVGSDNEGAVAALTAFWGAKTGPRTAACLVITGAIESKCGPIDSTPAASEPKAYSLGVGIRRCAAGPLEGAVAASWLAGAQSKHYCVILGLPPPADRRNDNSGLLVRTSWIHHGKRRDDTHNARGASRDADQAEMCTAERYATSQHARNFGVLGNSIASGSYSELEVGPELDSRPEGVP
jgi:hypothetical protein